MNANENTIHQFYTAFANGDPASMCQCYDPKIEFSDPVFGSLSGTAVCQMWQMLIEKSKGEIKIEVSNIKADEQFGTAQWIATYNFSKTNRKIVNSIQAQFHFKDGLIIKHTDVFSIWKWSKQAFGLFGFLFGWTAFMQKKIRNTALSSLKRYQEA